MSALAQVETNIKFKSEGFPYSIEKEEKGLISRIKGNIQV
jgi:hypothetical protein